VPHSWESLVSNATVFCIALFIIVVAS